MYLLNTNSEQDVNLSLFYLSESLLVDVDLSFSRHSNDPDLRVSISCNRILVSSANLSVNGFLANMSLNLR